MSFTSKQERDRNLAARDEPAGPINKHTILSPSSLKHVRHNLLIFSLSISFVTMNIFPLFFKPLKRKVSCDSHITANLGAPVDHRSLYYYYILTFPDISTRVAMFPSFHLLPRSGTTKLTRDVATLSMEKRAEQSGSSAISCVTFGRFERVTDCWLFRRIGEISGKLMGYIHISICIDTFADVFIATATRNSALRAH